MRSFDVFNGDADGIIALHQLRLAEPLEAELVTGVKRDVRLLANAKAASGDRVTVLDISLDANRDALLPLLAAGCRIFYADHHYAGEIPSSPFLTTHIDTAAEVCTSLIVDRLLSGRFRAWAVAAAFGDNLHETARRAAAPLALREDELAALRELGELLNYNGYGETTADLHIHPAELFRQLQPYADPLVFAREAKILPLLRDGFADDLRLARSIRPETAGRGRVFNLPACPWARRAAGVFSNEKAREEPDLAHAIMVDNGDGSFLVSVRAPLNRKTGADELCRQFPTGGGRAAAAGINKLPADQYGEFIDLFRERF